MPFTFKLSKRIALMKRALVTSAALVLACDRADLTGPQPPLSPPTLDVTSPDPTALAVVSVIASGDDGNVPQNTLDHNLATRWSANSDGQWIRYDLGALATMDRVDIAWYVGDTRIAYFDIQVSPDAVTWAGVFSGQSSGKTLQAESYTFPSVSGRYVRIVGHGNSEPSAWNSITEVALYPATTPSPVAQVSVTPGTTMLVVGGRQQLVATLTDGSGNVLAGRALTWTSSNVAVATVDSSGLVAGVAPGGVTITATSEGKSASVAIGVANMPVASVGITPATAVVPAGATLQLVASARDSAGNALSNHPITWASSASAVATVSSSGLVTGLAPGIATITATSDGKTGSAVVTVNPVPVASVNVSPAAASLDVDGTVQLTAMPQDPNGNPLSGRTVVWTTSNGLVATVSDSGLLTGVATGTATITATSEGVGGRAVIDVMNFPPSGVTVNPLAASVQAGARLQLTATVKHSSSSSVTWSSSAPTVATVNSSGLVTTLAAGVATITATSDGKTGSAAITVSLAPVVSMTVSPASARVDLGGTTWLTATLKDSAGSVMSGRAVTWASSSPTIATVSQTGLVAGVAAGPVTITATSEGKSASAAIRVANVPVASVLINPVTAVALVGTTVQLAATLLDSAGNVLSGRSLTWASSDPSVATVSPAGLVTGLAPGAATITGTSEGKTGSAAVTVNPVPVAAVSVSPTSVAIWVGQVVQLTAAPLDANGDALSDRTVKWVSSDPAVAVVSPGGLVTGLAVGVATVTATSEGKTGSAAITVSLVPVASVTVSPAAASLLVGATQQLAAVTQDSAGNVLTGRSVTWTTSNSALATVSAGGLVTGVAAGSATITATSEGQSGTAALTVTAPSCWTSAGAWQNTAIASQTGSFEARFDATPNTANMDGVVGLSNGPAADWTELAGIVLFSNTGTIQARNGSAYAAATIPYTAGTTYHFRLDLDVPSHTYTIYVTPAGAAEQLLGSNFAFRSEQATVSALANVGVYAIVGSVTVCNFALAPWAPPPVAAMTVSPAAASLLVGATQQLAAVTRDAAGNVLSGRAVTWASSSPGNATVSASGLVTGVAAGSATITATSEGQSGNAAVAVNPVPVASVAVSPDSAAVLVGQTLQLTATPLDASGNSLSGRTVTWTTSNSALATVSPTGLVTGVAAGSATITATSEGQSGTAALTVTAPSCWTSAGAWQNTAIASQTGSFEARFDATPNTANMDGVVGLSNGPAANWTDLAGIVLFSNTGTIQARNGSGYAAATTIPYTAGTTYHFRLDLDIPSHSYTIYVTPAGAAEQLLGSNFAFRSEQATVSTLTNVGLNAAVGSVTVCNVALAPWSPPPVASVTVSPAAASILLGQTVQLTAVVKDANGNVLTGRPVTWASSALGVASVSATGLVTALALGSATITATSEGQTGSAAITVSTGSSTAKHYYAAPAGSDANLCTAAAPCYTMRRVSQLLAPGDTAHFAPGNYTWSYSTNKVTVSGTASAPIVYLSDTKWGAKIYGSGCDPIWNGGDYVHIVNFDVTGNCSEGISTNGNYSKVIGNRVHDLPACTGGGCVAGILADCCNYHLTGIEILGNVVDNIAMNTTDPVQQNTIHGIYHAGPNGVIMNNIVTRAIAACITLYHGTTRMIVANNVVANCGRYGIQVSADASITTNDYTTVNNNIVVNVAGRGIQEYPATGSHNVFYHNIVYNNAPNFDLIDGTQAGTLTLTAAQFAGLFVNYTGDMHGDYHLKSGAVAIDAGTTLCAAGVSLCVPRIDFDGLLRPKGPALDIGAFEY